MSRLQGLSWLAWVALTLSPTALLAQEPHSDDLRITHAVAIPTPPGAPNGAAYLNISAGSAAVSLVDAHASVSDEVELHVTTMEDGAVRMRRLDSLDIAAGETIIMHPGGGTHLMLIGLDESLKEGMSFPMTLEFKELDSIQIEVQVSHTDVHNQGEGASHHSH